MKGILDWLVLDDKQKQKALDWFDSLPDTRQDIDEMDSCMSGHAVEACYYSSGIGDVFYLHTVINGTTHRCSLAYDDDGELS